MKFFLTGALSLFFVCHLYAQNIDSLKYQLSVADDDSVRILVLNQLIEKTRRSGQPDKMFDYLGKLYRLSSESNDLSGIINFYKSSGQYYFMYSHKFDTALFLMHKGLALLNKHHTLEDRREKIARFYNTIGLIHKNKSAYDSALFYYQKVLHELEGDATIFDKWQVTLNLSKMHSAMGNYHRAQQYAFQCLSIAKRSDTIYGSFNINTMASSYRVLAENYYFQRSYDLAFQYIDKSLAHLAKHPEQMASHIAYLYELKARCFLRTDKLEKEKAIIYYSKYHEYLLKTYGHGHPKLFDSHFTLSEISLAVQNYTLAAKNLEQASEIVKSKKDPRYYSLLIAKGHLQRKLGNSAKALAYYCQALKYDIIPNNAKNSLLQAIGDLYREQGALKKSLGYYNRSIIRSPDGISDLPNDTSDRIAINWSNVDAILKRASVYEEFFSKKGKDLQDLRSALSSYQICDTLITELRNLQKLADHRIDINRLSDKVYKGAVRTSTQLYGYTKEKNYLEQSFYFSERSKAQVLSEALTVHTDIQFADLPDSLNYLESDLKSTIEYYQSKLQQARLSKESVNAARYESALFSSKRDYEHLMFNLEKDYPDYFQLKYDDTKLISIHEVGKQLSGAQTLIEYFIGDDSLYIYLINKRNFQLVKSPISSGLDSLVINFKSAILAKDRRGSALYGHKLYQILFEPLEKHINTKELIIVPDGVLWYVNFDLLVKTSEPEKDKFRSYLINDYAISYANSANLLIQRKLTAPKVFSKKCLAFSYADSTEDQSGTMDFIALRNANGKLPGTRLEIARIADLIPGTYFYGSKANESNFKQQSANYAILHLAMHGEIDDVNPNNSRLNFPVNTGDKTEDNFLYAFELYNMRLNADLAVLSACNTGMGQLAKGEGIMSLGRAFQYAGVKSLLISNWEIVDDVAPEIVTGFYKYLTKGLSKSEALRRSKLDYLKEAGVHRSDPFYWAGFSVIGDPSSIDFKDDWYDLPRIVYSLIAIIIIFAGIIFYRRLN